MAAPLLVLLATLFVTMAMAALTLVPRPPPQPRVTPIRPLERVEVQVETSTIAVPAAEQLRCRAPVHRANADGTVDYTFETCTR